MTTKQARKTAVKSKTSSTITTDHTLIRRWAEARNAKPASVKGTGGKSVGVLRLMFPGFGAEKSQSLREISWDEFFKKFDESKLAFIYQDKTSSGIPSNFNKFINRK